MCQAFIIGFVKQIIVATVIILGIFTSVLLLISNRYNPKGLSINQVSAKLVNRPALQVPGKQSGMQWGAYTGTTVEQKKEFEETIGTKLDMLSTFVFWSGDNSFPTEIANEAKINNQTLIIYWESRDSKLRNLNDEKFSYDAIIRGDWDDYIYSFGKSIDDLQQNVILIPFIEMNGNWYPWSITKNGNSAEKHKLAYRKIHDMLGSIPNLEFGWVVNNGSAPDSFENDPLNLYPGDEYVDYVGVDGFNFGDPWQEFDEVFGEILTTLKTFNKPIMIFSMASADGPKKSRWIEDMSAQLQKHPEVRGFVWFNEDKERDWRIWSDPESLESFRQMLKAIK